MSEHFHSNAVWNLHDSLRVLGHGRLDASQLEQLQFLWGFPHANAVLDVHHSLRVLGDGRAVAGNFEQLMDIERMPRI